MEKLSKKEFKARLAKFQREADELKVELDSINKQVKCLPRDSEKNKLINLLMIKANLVEADVFAEKPLRPTWNSARWLSEAESKKIEMRQWLSAGKAEQAERCRKEVERAHEYAKKLLTTEKLSTNL